MSEPESSREVVGRRIPVHRVAELVDRARSLPGPAAGSGRRLLGLVGAPGAGKTTIGLQLVRLLGPSAVHVPMDGYHLADAALRRNGTLDLKGAPQTFDGWGYLSFLQRLRSETGHPLYAPAFERDLEQPLANSIEVLPEHDYVVSEGNYLLSAEEPWPQVRACFDQVWFVGMDETERLRRLIARHVEFGKTPEVAREWVLAKDENNAALIAATEPAADVALDVTDLVLD